MLSAARTVDVSKLVELLRVPAVFAPFTHWGAVDPQGRFGVPDELSIRVDPRSPAEEVYVVGAMNRVRAGAEGPAVAKYKVANLADPRTGSLPAKEHYTGSYMLLQDPLHNLAPGDSRAWSQRQAHQPFAFNYHSGWYVPEYTLHYIAWAFYASRGKRGMAESISFPVDVRIGGREHRPWNTPEVARVSFGRVTRDGTVMLNVGGFGRKCEIPLSAFREAMAETQATLDEEFAQLPHYMKETGMRPLQSLRTIGYCNDNPWSYFVPDDIPKVLIAWDRFVEEGLLGTRAKYLVRR